MKVVLKGKLGNISRWSSGETAIELQLEGKAEGVPLTAKTASMRATLNIKNLVAEQLSLGSRLIVTICEEQDEAEDSEDSES